MESLFVYVVNHYADKKPWCTTPTNGILSETDKNSKGLTPTKVTKYWSCKVDVNSWDCFYRQAFLIRKLVSFCSNYHTALRPLHPEYCTVWNVNWQPTALVPTFSVEKEWVSDLVSDSMSEYRASPPNMLLLPSFCPSISHRAVCSH